jgi:hypothetical protein
LLSAAIGSFRAARRTQDDELLQHVGYGLLSALVVAMLLTAFFDIFAFPMAIGALALTVGLSGGYLHVLAWRRGSAEAKP